MKLSKKALDAIDNMTTRMKLGIALKRSENSIKRYIDDNDIILTTSVSIELIKKETGLSEEEIFEKETVRP